jgi:twitching motility protein PilT
VAGPTGSGKSTTLAAMLEEINLTKQKHIITLEDPIEYLFTPKKSLIEQKQL